MSGIVKTVISVVAFAAAFAAVKHGMTSYRQSQALAKAEQTLEQIKRDGARKHPNVPVAEGIHQEAVEKTTAMLDAQSNDKKRLQTAASTFMGFFLVNARERVEFCQEQGVSVAPFVSAFERAHTTELAAARAALSETSVNEDQLYKMLKPQLRKVIADDMNEAANTQKISLKQACELVSTNGAALASEMHISKVQPAVHKVLASGR